MSDTNGRTSRQRPDDRRFRPSSDRLLAVAQVFGLWAFAVAQPVLDLIGSEPDFLIAHRLDGLQVALLALAIAIGIPALLAAPMLADRVWSRRVGRIWAGALRALLAATFLLQMLNLAAPVRLPATLLFALAAGGGLATALLLARSRVAALGVTLTAIAALISPAVFLLRPEIRGLIPGESRADHEPNAEMAAASSFSSETPVLMVVFDELPTSSLQRPDQTIDAARFPSFAALAREATWYRRATTVGIQTPRAIPAILTGQLPRPDTSGANHRNHPSSLFTWLHASGGYRVTASEFVSRLCPPSVCADPTAAAPLRQLIAAVDDLAVVFSHQVAPHTLRYRLPSISHAWGGFRDSRREAATARPGPGLYMDVRSAADDFLDRMTSSDRQPDFFYLHLNLPHRPWKYLPSGREYPPAGARLVPAGFDRRRLPDDEQVTVQGLQRHLLQVGFADRVLGRVLTRLKTLGLYERSLIVVTADHGISFRPGEHRRAAAGQNLEDVLEVPLFVKRPGQREGAVLEHHVQTIDIVPTVAAELGAELPWTVDGVSVHSTAPREVSACCYSVARATRTFTTDPVRRQQTLDRIARLFGSGDDESAPFHGVFAHGPRPDLLGRDAASLAAVPSSFSTTAAAGPAADAEAPLSVHLNGESAFRNVRPESSFVPSLVTGRIEPRVADGTPLAIAVDGVVRATTTTFTEREASRFSALVPERWLPAGERILRMYLIEERPAGQASAGRTALRPLGEPPRPRLVADGRVIHGLELHGRVLAAEHERPFRARTEVLAGHLTSTLILPAEVPLPALDEFFVFRGDDLVYQGMDDPFMRRLTDGREGERVVTLRISLPHALLAEAPEQLRLLMRSGGIVRNLPLLSTEPGHYSLVRNDDGRHVALLWRAPGDLAGASQRIPVGSSMDGLAGSVGSRSEGAFVGWAADFRNPGDLLDIVAFLGDEKLASGLTGVYRPDVAARYGPGHGHTGFTLTRAQSQARRVAGRIREEGAAIYAIAPRGLAVRLNVVHHPLERRFRGETLPMGDGRRLPVQPAGHGLGGQVDLVTSNDGGTFVEGWAGDLERGEAPRRIAIYRDGEFLTGGNGRRPRRDVAETHDDPGLLRTGFRIEVPDSPLPDEFAERHRIFALMKRGVAVELPLPGTP